MRDINVTVKSGTSLPRWVKSSAVPPLSLGARTEPWGPHAVVWAKSHQPVWQSPHWGTSLWSPRRGENYFTFHLFSAYYTRNVKCHSEAYQVHLSQANVCDWRGLDEAGAVAGPAAPCRGILYSKCTEHWPIKLKKQHIIHAVNFPAQLSWNSK